ncbi:MAG: site-specific integrase, partial [Propionibacteriaceae bacterium]|nr:site-specific integrase [Propionibacteriaceae bacterium]
MDPAAHESPQEGLSPAIDAWADHLRLERNLADHTRRAYAGDLDNLAAFLAGRGTADWSLVDHRDLRAWLAELHRRGAERTTVARRATASRVFFAWATDTGRVPHDPAGALQAPRADRTLPPTQDPRPASGLLAHLAPPI